MYKSKTRVDQQARGILSKLRDDNERRLRGFQLGNLYFQAREYEQAKEYVSLFLTVKDQYAPAHKLMGQIYERSSVYDDIKKAISHYKRSYELDESQQQLTLKICSLYLRIDLPPELSTSQTHWIELAKGYYPNDPVIFNLQEKLINQSMKLPAESLNSSMALTDMEDLLITNLKSRPADINVRLKLVKCLNNGEKYDSAVNYIREVIETSPYCDSYDWCSYSADVLQSLAEKGSDEVCWCLYLLSAYGATRLAVKSKTENIAITLLTRLDKALYKSLKHKGQLLGSVRSEIISQQLLLSAYLVSRRDGALVTHSDDILALYVSAFSQRNGDSGPESAENGENELNELVTRLRSNRLVQAGYTILHQAPEVDRPNWLRKLSQNYFSSEGKKRIYRLVFGDKSDSDSSMFMSEPSLESIQAIIPSHDELQSYCVTAQKLYPHSLHHQTWLALRQPDQQQIPQYMFELYNRLEHSAQRLMQHDPESISHMDLAVFVLLTAYSAKQRHDNNVSGRVVKPADLTASLCSEDQARWWTAVYETSSRTSLTTSVVKYGRQRQLISRGLQTVRLIENHGLSAQMLSHISKLLQSKLDGLKSNALHVGAHIVSVTSWTQKYWSETVRILYAKQRNHTLPIPRERLFYSYDDDLAPDEQNSLLSEGRLWLALQMYEEEREDEALAELRDLPQAIASYTAAQIYKSRITEDTDAAVRENLLVRIQEFLYLTVDRLAEDKSHPLNAAVEQELESLETDIEAQSFLSANESMVNAHTATNGNSVPSTPLSVRLAGNLRSTPLSTTRSRAVSGLGRTPASSDQTDASPMRVRPSPERLQLQIRSMVKVQDELKATLSEDREMMADTSKQMIDTVRRVLDNKLDTVYETHRELSKRMSEIISSDKQLSEMVADVHRSMARNQEQIRNDLDEMRTLIRQKAPPTPAPTDSGSTPSQQQSSAQISFLQQQITALTSMMAMGQHQMAVPQGQPPAAALAALQQQATLSGYGTPVRGTPPVYPGGHGAELMHLGTYPHIQSNQTPVSGPGSCRGGGLTEQEMEAAALAAVEHGYDDREYYVDDGNDYYGYEGGGDEYGDQDLSSYVGAEGGNTIAYMPKTSGLGMPMPLPGFFSKPDKSQTKIAEPKPAEQGIPPNVVMNKELMNADAGKKQQHPTQSPLVVNVPKTVSAGAANNSNNAAVTSPVKKLVHPSPAKSDTDVHNDSSHDPQFEPVIELPPEVDVVTGEENEEVLFEGRAKLFRMVDKEWKERGIGVFKILERNDTPGKCRVVMRRDQVHKVCANHAIHEAMSIAPQGQKGNAYIWTATDYSEDNPTNETFAIRFKSAEIGDEFKAAFNSAREKSKSSGNQQPTVVKKEKEPAKGAAQGWGNLLPKTPQWKCSGCLCSNDMKITKCPACGTAQPGVTITDTPLSAAKPATSTAPTAAMIFGGNSPFGKPAASTASQVPSALSMFGTKGPAVTTSAVAATETPDSTDDDESGSTTPPQEGETTNLFAAKPDTSQGLFGKPSEPPKPSLFGSSTPGGLFGKPARTQVTPQSIFGSAAATPQNVFGGAPKPAVNTGGLFGTAAPTATPTAQSQGAGIFGSKPPLFSKPPASESGKSEGDGGSLLRQLLTAEAKAPASKPTEKVSMGGFTFTAPPKIEEKPDAKPTAEKASVSPFASFGGLSATQPSSGLFGTKPKDNSASSTGFAFTAATTGLFSSPSLAAAVKSDMKTSSSAPQLGTDKEVTTAAPSSKDDSVLSPTKAAEEECSAEFTPVIPLPELVDAKTGEEDEEVTFSERCKLFRMIDSQWKERGIGELKILRHKTKLSYRLVMRREQVLKLCANHKLHAGMKLAQSGEKARIWAAQDFCDNELRNETLCARFKTAEIADEFEEAFVTACEQAVSKGNTPEKTKATTPVKVAVAGPQAKLGDLFANKSGEWNCSGCRVKNKADTNRCACCNTPQPGTENDPPTGQKPSGGLFGTPAAAKPQSAASIFGNAQSNASSIFGAQPKSNAASIFGNVAAQPTTDMSVLFGLPTKPGTPADSAASIFGTQATMTSTSETSVPASPGKYVAEEGEGDNIHFEPVIELPDLVDVKTGEEEEDVLYIHKAKLYRFVKGEYKERGLGDVKILKHKVTSKVRLILRREKVHKLACNHLIAPDMQLRAMDNTAGKAWVWYAVDFAEGAQTDEMFAIRFKTAEIASEFKTAFDAARDGKPVSPQQFRTVCTESPQKSRSRPPSESQTGAGTPNKDQTAAAKSLFSTPVLQQAKLADSTKSPHEQSKEAAALFGGAKSKIPVASGKSTPTTTPQSLFGKPTGQSPAAVFGAAAAEQKTLSPFGKMAQQRQQSVFGGNSATQGSVTPQSLFGKPSETPTKPGSVFGGSAATTPSSQASSLFGAKPSPQNLFGGLGKKGATFNGGQTLSSPSQPEDADVEFVGETKPTEELMRKAKDFLLPSGFYLYEQRKPCKGCLGCEKNENDILDHLFHDKPYNKKVGLSPAPKSKPTAAAAAPVSEGPMSGFAAFSSTGTDFSSLGGATSNAFKKTDGFKWSGAGASLFGGSSPGGANQNEENPEAYEVSADFKPVLDVLPDLIDVKTGEEDEEKIFCHRAKLFRFDGATKQWKERGIGEMKLLKHHANGTVRVLLRREQVHKLVCNHLVMPDMELKPMATSETAWCWFAKDYSDNETLSDTAERFAVKFKNIALAQEFKDRFEESKEFVVEGKNKKNNLNDLNASASNQSVTVNAESDDSVEEEDENSEEEGEEEGGDDDYEDDSDDSDDEPYRMVFERQVTLFEKQGDRYSKIGVRQLQIMEENMDIIGGFAVYVMKGEEVEYRQLIFQETPQPIYQGATCAWQMYNFQTERPHLTHFQAQFASTDASAEFARHITDGIAYAKELKIQEVEAIRAAMTTNPTELDLSKSASNFNQNNTAE